MRQCISTLMMHYWSVITWTESVKWLFGRTKPVSQSMCNISHIFLIFCCIISPCVWGVPPSCFKLIAAVWSSIARCLHRDDKVYLILNHLYWMTAWKAYLSSHLTLISVFPDVSYHGSCFLPPSSCFFAICWAAGKRPSSKSWVWGLFWALDAGSHL